MFDPVDVNFRAGRFLAQRQLFAGLQVEIFAQTDELIRVCHTRQSQIRRTFAEPLAGNVLPFGVVVANRNVFFEVPFRIRQTVLRFRCQHLS
ncbi:MAG: hypothetical protein JWM68_1468 [Verrucomicrobiales bacterium]|nr:hypothetical protein [Verrucomicrobiales bacterium]